MSQFVFHVKDLDEGGRDYVFDVDVEWAERMLKGAELRLDPGAKVSRFVVHAQRSGRDVLVRGSLESAVIVPCCRCLGDAAIAIHASMDLLLQPRAADARELAQEAQEDTEEGPDREFFSGDEIALDPYARELFLLECPIQPLCAEDCPGIDIPVHLRPPAELSRTSKQVDPRLAPLMKFASAGTRRSPNQE